MTEEKQDRRVFIGVKVLPTTKKQLDEVAIELHTDTSKIIRAAIREHLSGPSVLGFQRIILSTLFQSMENNLTFMLVMLDRMAKDAEGEELEYYMKNRASISKQLAEIREVVDGIEKDDWTVFDKFAKSMGGGRPTVQDLMEELEKK